MTINKDLKNKVIQKITDILEKDGTDTKAINELRKNYPDISKTTFYRWVNKIKASGEPANKAALRIKRKAAVNQRADRREKGIDNRLTEVLPVKVTPNDICPSGYLNAVDQIRQCVGHAEKVIEHCRTKDGKIKNPKLYIQASKHILDGMKTAACVSGQIMEAQKVEKFHQAILSKLKEKDPAFVEEVLEALDKLNNEWGVI